MAGKKAKRKHVRVKTSASSTKQTLHPYSGDSEAGLRSCALSDDVHTLHPISGDTSKSCRHLEKGIDTDKLSSHVSKGKFNVIHCQDCAKESKSGSGKKVKGRSNRKKESAVRSQKKWVCLACGHIACGWFTESNGSLKELEDNDQTGEEKFAPSGHVQKHSLCSRHPLALQTTDDLIWCFLCNMAVHSRGSKLSLTASPLQEALKIMHENLNKGTILSKDIGEADSTRDQVSPHVGETTRLIDSAVPPVLNMDVIGPRRKRVIRGLMNLGNTCFFNSVMQNLLALDKLRDYFSQELPGMEGPLTSSLKRLFLETNFDGGGQLLKSTTESSGYESGLKKGFKGRATSENIGAVCNPRSLFGAVCSKAPRFRGFQQQDSHELLQCLLDGLTSEERNVRAKHSGSEIMEEATNDTLASRSSINGRSFEGGQVSQITRPPPTVAMTVVENFFGGQLCSTVRCCECGHSSVVFEPMLDLSLQIPSLKKRQTSVKQSKLYLARTRSQQNGRQVLRPPQKASHSVSLCIHQSEVNRSMGPLQNGKPSEAAKNSMSPQDSASPAESVTLKDSNEDCGWLDFITGGTQSAESSQQIPSDILSSVEVSQTNLIVDSKDQKREHFSTDTSISSIIEAQTVVMANVVDSTISGTDKQDNKFDADRMLSETLIGADGEKNISHLECDSNPLPLATGVLLLPYEPLHMPVTSREETSVTSVSPDLDGTLREELASPFIEPDTCLDGFSQLFEEEESCAPDMDLKFTCSNMEKSNAIDETDQDDEGWEEDAAVHGKGEPEALSEILAETDDGLVPMSLESCLADFTKPELLSGENSWECESCTRREKGIPLPEEISQTTMESEPSNSSSDSKRLLSSSEDEISEQLIPENCGEVNVESINDAPSIYALMDNSVNGSGHSRNSDDGKQLVSGFSSPQANGKMGIIMDTYLATEMIAESHTKGQEVESDIEGEHGTTILHSYALQSCSENTGDESCRSLSPSCSSNKGNRIKLENKPMKDAKPKSKRRQPVDKFVKRDATKRLSISKAPAILIVHLKRFAQDPRGRLSKLSGHVSFPEILNLQPFLDTRCQDAGNCFYQLVGVVEHGGTMRGGHYIAYVRNAGVEGAISGAEQEVKDDWYYISDSSVHKTSLQAVLSSEAYLLFYEKCQVKRQN
ncbi:hypothetical protein KP509_15G074500 [Ceratopteris richardii]|uniref:Ubiquitinyl hydrolase 1 n=1 Tax=Ceratopteris richardii TaxID=49495 RepID=A0A8T2T676_CERRI|nr:hypothetical protein KP509_15G074500 [Ceratopteris richardii]